MLVAECDKGGVTMRLRSEVLSVERDESGFVLALNGETVTTQKLVIASGGLSMPGLAHHRLAIKSPNSLVSRCCRRAPGWCLYPT